METLDDAEFTARWVAAQPVVASVLTAMLGDWHAVDDVLQEVSLAVLGQRERYDPARPFTPWAVGIARHKAVDHLRREGRKRQVVADPVVLDHLAEVAAEPEFADECRSRELALHQCLRRLSAKARRVVRAIYHDGLSAEECAAREGGKPGAVWTMLSRVRTQLRGCIERRLEQGA